MRYKSPERRLEFLEAYVEFQVLALAAAAEGLGSDPKVVDVLKRDLASRYLIENFDLKQRTTDISEDVIREFYDSHPWVFSHPAQNHVFRILCSDRTQAAKVAYRVRSLVESATGDPLDVFREHVARSSVDPAAFRTSGDIGIYPSAGGSSASVPVQVAAAAEALDTLHQVSDPVEAPDGWSVLFLARQIPPVSKDIDQARAEIAGMILDARRLEARPGRFTDSSAEGVRFAGGEPRTVVRSGCGRYCCPEESGSGEVQVSINKSAVLLFAAALAISFSAVGLEQAAEGSKAASQGFVVDTVVATVGTDVITQYDVKKRMQITSTPLASIMAGGTGMEDESAQFKQALDDLISDMLVLKEARKSGITVPREEVDAHVDQLKKRNNWTDSDFAVAVGMLGFEGVDAYRAHASNELLKSKVLRMKIGGRISVSDREVQEILRQVRGGKTRRRSTLRTSQSPFRTM